jgi:hypothetical protein
VHVRGFLSSVSVLLLGVVCAACSGDDNGSINTPLAPRSPLSESPTSPLQDSSLNVPFEPSSPFEAPGDFGGSPDFTPSSFTLESTDIDLSFGDENVSGSVILANIGSVDATLVEYSVYVSDDASGNVDESDTLIESFVLPALPEGTQIQIVFDGTDESQITFPASDPIWLPGTETYYVVVIMDSFLAVGEKSETNNISNVIEIQVTTPDT